MQQAKGNPLDGLEIRMDKVRQTFTSRSDMLRKNKLQIINPQPGKDFDPKSDNFKSLDGVYKAYQYWLSGDHIKAKNQLRDISLRFLLKNQFGSLSYNVKYSDNREIVSGSGAANNHQLAIMGCIAYEIPLEITHKMLRTLTGLPRSGVRYDADYWVARCYIAGGAYEKALKLYLSANDFHMREVIWEQSAQMAQIHGTWIIKKGSVQ